MMCQALKVSRASFYRWRTPKAPTPRQQRHQQLVAAVKAAHHHAEGMAGRQQLTRMLANRGVEVSESTVGAIMRAHGLQAIRTKAWKQTTVPDPHAHTAHIDNHMVDGHGNRDFSSTQPGTRLVGDITYLKTGQGWLYLATVIDLCTGMVMGWNTANHMRTDLAIGALAMARDQGYLASDKVIYHSDRGSQYTSAQFQAWCAGNGITQSMGRTGVCLGQRRGGELVFAFQDRVLPSPELCHPPPGGSCRPGLHRVLVQPPPAQCSNRWSTTITSLDRGSDQQPRTLGCITRKNHRRNCLKKLTSAGCPQVLQGFFKVR